MIYPSYNAIDPTQVFNQDEIDDDSGLHLGMMGIGRTGCLYILSEAGEDLVRGNIVVDKIRYTEDGITYTEATRKISIASAGSSVAANKMIGGLVIVNDDDNTVNPFDFVESQPVITSGSAMEFYIKTAFSTAPAGTIDIGVFDGYYCELAAANVLIQVVIGVAPIAVDQSVRPYFWRQVTGLCGVLAGEAVQKGVRLIPGDDTEGQAIAIDDAANDTLTPFGAVPYNDECINQAADTPCVARIRCLW